MEEIWKDVKGFEGRYQVSNMGRVRSLDRTTIDKVGRVHHTRGMILKDSLNNWRGYYRVSLSDGHRNYTHYEVHRLVALHFVPGYEEGLVVNHKNEIKTDNRAENLEWCTQGYNLKYSDVIGWKRKPVYQYDLDGNFIQKHKCCAVAEKMMGARKGAMVYVMYESKVGMWRGYRWSFDFRTKGQWENILKTHKSSYKPIVQLNDDGSEVRRFNTASEAAKMMGVSVAAISNCAKGKTKKAAGYNWRYLY